MSTETKMAVNFYSTIITRAVMIALTTLTSIVFYDIRDNMKTIKEEAKSSNEKIENSFKEVTTNVNDLKSRIIRLETKIEDGDMADKAYRLKKN